MNSFTRYSVVVLIVVLVCACSGKQERTEPEGYLATQISEDNRKQFVYSLEFPKLDGGGRGGRMRGHMSGSSSRGVSGGVSTGTGGKGRGSHGGGRQGGGRGGADVQRNINDTLETMLERELKKTAFCRDGYKELERATTPPQIYLKGECNESATENDFEEFPNPLDV